MFHKIVYVKKPPEKLVDFSVDATSDYAGGGGENTDSLVANKGADPEVSTIHKA